MSRDLTTPRASRWPIAVVVLVALCAMSRACGLDWSGFDDDLFLTRNPLLNPPAFATFGAFVWHPFRGLWTPATNAVWWIVARGAYLDVADPGGVRLNPWFFHSLNVALHAINAALAFALLRRIVRDPWAAAIGAGVFAAHPVQVEVVAWACGTKDVLAATFSLAALVAIARPAPRALHVIACIAFAALAMTSKPSAAVLPALIAIVAWAVGGATRASWIAVAGTVALAIPTLVVARVVQAVGDVPFVPPIARPIVALDALAIHAWHVVWPLGRCADYGFAPTLLFTSTRRWWTWLVPAAIAFVVGRSRDRAIVCGAAIFAVALAPNLGLTPFQFQVYTTVADRYAYLAMLGVAMIVSRVVDRTVPGRRPGAVIVVALLAISVVRVGDWRDAASLWQRALAINPASVLGNANLGVVELGAGDLAAARAHLERVASDPAGGFALVNLVALELCDDRPDAAADAAIRLVRLFRTRSDYDPMLERRTVERFARQIARRSPEAAERLRNVAVPLTAAE